VTSGDVRETVREAAAAHAPLRIAGRGTWLDAGRPVQAARTLSLSGLTGVVEYQPGDFTLTARAGTTLAELADATRPHQQFLALDPFGDADGTLGATVATGASGPMAYAFGGPRDNVIGLEAVTGDGAIVRCGGRVVKNVAGFDLTRLFTGSWGTLGVVTEVSVRLRAIPQVDETYYLAVDDQPEKLKELIATLRVASIAPLAMELVFPSRALRVDAPTLLVRLSGNAASVRAQRSVLAGFGDVEQSPMSTWAALRVELPDVIAARVSTRPSRVAEVCAQARQAVASATDAVIIASVGRGVVRCLLPANAHEAARSLARCDATVIFEKLPAFLWSELAPSPVSDRLSRSVKERFDPASILNPGLLGEAGSP
jgi:glycolate oxidase FAD binding subunit